MGVGGGFEGSWLLSFWISGCEDLVFSRCIFKFFFVVVLIMFRKGSLVFLEVFLEMANMFDRVFVDAFFSSGREVRFSLELLLLFKFEMVVIFGKYIFC